MTTGETKNAYIFLFRKVLELCPLGRPRKWWGRNMSTDISDYDKRWDGTGSVSCLMVGLNNSSIELSGPAIRVSLA
jgi:hypothetical protein